MKTSMTKIINGRSIALLALFFVLTYLLPLNSRLLWQPDETRYAEISREMLQRGDWVVPHLLGVRYFEKPVAGYWINNISQWLLGDSNFSVRFGSVFCSALSAGLLFWLAWLLWRDSRRAFAAALIYLSSLLVSGVGTYSVLDPMISLWMMAAMFSSYLMLQPATRRKKIAAYLLLGLACGMGFMTKGFLALVLPVISLLPVVIQQRQFKPLVIFGPIALFAALLISSPWMLAIAMREPDFWHYFFWVEHIQRFAADNAQHKAPGWYYLPLLFAGALPWAGLLPGALINAWRKRAECPELFFLLSWLLMPLFFFSLAKGKLLTYILPCMAPLALLMAAWATDCAATLQTRVFKINSVINLLAGAVCVLGVLLSGYATVIPLLPPQLQQIFQQISPFSPQENINILLAATAFAAWGLIGYWSGKNSAQRWQWAAICPLLLSLFLADILPQKIINAKQPQYFIGHNIALLRESRYLLTDNVGLAAGLAWELKRSDILMLGEKGELSYGLDYPDAAGRWINKTDFSAWLAAARMQGDVSLVLQLAEGEDLSVLLPTADKISRIHRFILLWYKKQP